MLYGLQPYTTCFKLIPNKMKNASSSFIAHSDPRGIMDAEDLYNKMEHGGTAGLFHSAGQLELAVKTILDAAILAMLDGYDVDLCGMLRLRVSISGGFDSEWDDFDRDRNRISVTVAAGDALKRKLAKTALAVDAQFANDSRECGAPTVRTVRDPITYGKKHVDLHEVSQNEDVIIQGYRMATDFTDPRQGVELVSADGTAYRALGGCSGGNTTIFCRIPPDVPLGTYTLVVRNGRQGVFPLPDSMIAEGRFYPLKVTDKPVPDRPVSHAHRYQVQSRIKVKGNGRWKMNIF